MSTIERKEKIIISYDGSKIVIRGSTFKLASAMTTMGLMGIYTSGEGESVAQLFVDVPDVETQPEEKQPEEKTLAEELNISENVVASNAYSESPEIIANTEPESIEVIMIDADNDYIEATEEDSTPTEFDLSDNGINDSPIKKLDEVEFDIIEPEKEEIDPFNRKGPTGEKWSDFG